MPKTKTPKPTQFEKYLNNIRKEKWEIRKEIYDTILGKSNTFPRSPVFIRSKAVHESQYEYLKRKFDYMLHKIDTLRRYDKEIKTVGHFANDLGLIFSRCFDKTGGATLAFKRNKMTNEEILSKISDNCKMPEKIYNIRIEYWRDVFHIEIRY